MYCASNDPQHAIITLTVSCIGKSLQEVGLVSARWQSTFLQQLLQLRHLQAPENGSRVADRTVAFQQVGEDSSCIVIVMETDIQCTHN